MSTKKILIYIGGLISLLVLLTTTTFGQSVINTITAGYHVLKNTPVKITANTLTANSVCKNVTCTGGQDIFVPTNSTKEWSAL